MAKLKITGGYIETEDPKPEGTAILRVICERLVSLQEAKNNRAHIVQALMSRGYSGSFELPKIRLAYELVKLEFEHLF